MFVTGHRQLRRRMVRSLAAGVVFCAPLLCGKAAHAQDGKGAYIGQWSISGGASYAIPNTDEYANVFAWRAGIGYSPIPQFEVGLEVGRFSTDVSQPDPDGVPEHDIASGRLDVLPVNLTLQYRAALPGSMTTVLLSAGVGYYFVDYTMAEEQRAFYSGASGLPDQSVSNALGAHAGAGLEYALTSWFSVMAEARYVFLAPRVSGTTKDNHEITGSLDLNTWLFTGGIKVAF